MTTSSYLQRVQIVLPENAPDAVHPQAQRPRVPWDSWINDEVRIVLQLIKDADSLYAGVAAEDVAAALAIRRLGGRRRIRGTRERPSSSGWPAP